MRQSFARACELQTKRPRAAPPIAAVSRDSEQFALNRLKTATHVGSQRAVSGLPKKQLLDHPWSMNNFHERRARSQRTIVLIRTEFSLPAFRSERSGARQSISSSFQRYRWYADGSLKHEVPPAASPHSDSSAALRAPRCHLPA